MKMKNSYFNILIIGLLSASPAEATRIGVVHRQFEGGFRHTHLNVLIQGNWGTTVNINVSPDKNQIENMDINSTHQGNQVVSDVP